MARKAASDSRLPEPNHPFSRWFGGACAALWAVGVRALPDTWNKLLAILTPGIGYVTGNGLDLAREYYADSVLQRQLLRQRNQPLKEIKSSIAIISKELENAKKDSDLVPNL